MPKIKDTCRTIIILSWSCFYQFSSFLLSFFHLLCPFSTWDPNNSFLPPHLSSFLNSLPLLFAQYVSAGSVCLLLETPPVSLLVQTHGERAGLITTCFSLSSPGGERAGGRKERRENERMQERWGLEGGIIEGRKR